MKTRNLIAIIVMGGLITTSPLMQAWAGDIMTNDIRITVSALPNCYADTTALTFDLGTVDTPQQEIAKTKVVKLSCDAPAKVTLRGTLQQGSAAQAGGAIPSLSGCETVGQQQCFDLTQAGHTFDVPAAGADVGIKVAYLAPAGLGTDSFSGQLTVSWP